MNQPIVAEIAENHKLVTIGSESDGTRLIVPCYRFETHELGASYAAADIYSRNVRFLLGIRNLGATVIMPAAYSQYMPRNGVELQWHTNQLMANDRYLRSDNEPVQLWTSLRLQATPRLEGLRNHNILLVGGRRLFNLSSGSTAKTSPSWCHRLAVGNRHCFAAWGRQRDGQPLGKLVDGEASDTAIYAAKTARGVLYARTTTFDSAGQPDGHRTEIVFIDVCILDKDENQDDNMRLRIYARAWRNLDCDISDPDPAWNTLIKAAQEGFEASCQPIPPALEEWRQFFLGQKARVETERQKYCPAVAGPGRYSPGPNFQRDIRAEGMDWRKALDLVQEPWQLQLVIEAYCDESFNKYPLDSTGERVQHMLDTYNCTPSRREQLEKMIADYVAIVDEKWNHPAAA